MHLETVCFVKLSEGCKFIVGILTCLSNKWIELIRWRINLYHHGIRVNFRMILLQFPIKGLSLRSAAAIVCSLQFSRLLKMNVEQGWSHDSKAIRSSSHDTILHLEDKFYPLPFIRCIQSLYSFFFTFSKWSGNFISLQENYFKEIVISSTT